MSPTSNLFQGKWGTAFGFVVLVSAGSILFVLLLLQRWFSQVLWLHGHRVILVVVFLGSSLPPSFKYVNIGCFAVNMSLVNM